MIQWVVEAAWAARIADQVLVATPDQEIVDACSRFGAESILTSPNHPSGTDRIAEVAESHPSDFYVNVQGDEPLIDPETIRACAQPLIEDPEIVMSSVFCECPSDEFDNPAVVKVVTDIDQNALYFSRYPVPFARSGRTSVVKRHLGLYAYRGSVLASFAKWAPSPLETAESLEQLRFLEHGVRIRMSETKPSDVSVDTPEQAELVRQILRMRHQVHHSSTI